MASTHQESSSLSFRLNLYLRETLEPRLDLAFPVFELVFSAILCRFLGFLSVILPPLYPPAFYYTLLGFHFTLLSPLTASQRLDYLHFLSKHGNRSKLCFSAYIRRRFSRRGLLGLNCQAPLRINLIRDEQGREQRVCRIESTTLFEI